MGMQLVLEVKIGQLDRRQDSIIQIEVTALTLDAASARE